MVQKEMYLTGNIFTQCIERNDLTLSPRIKRLVRRTICFSRSIELHKKVIDAFIEKHMLSQLDTSQKIIYPCIFILLLQQLRLNL